MRSTYKKEDVILLLKDITGLVQPESTEERERQIQEGRHYCEMLPIEYVPSREYMQVYQESLTIFAKPVADAIRKLAKKIIQQKGENVVLVSLARAGIPIGILLKRYLEKGYGIKVCHYSISIIRGKGIDEVAMKYLLERYLPEDLLFVDGWVGKGAILRELQKDIAAFSGVSSEIAVVADPAGVTNLCGTHEDILIPSACLNSTVCGLVSRTFLRDDIIKPGDFHGAVYYGELKDADLSYEFIHAIENAFTYPADKEKELHEQEHAAFEEKLTNPGMDEVKSIAREFGITDINLVKPGIGEATRVLLRRVPWKILISEDGMEQKELAHLIRLAKEKNVPVSTYPLKRYKACGLIKKIADA